MYTHEQRLLDETNCRQSAAWLVHGDILRICDGKLGIGVIFKI